MKKRVLFVLFVLSFSSIFAQTEDAWVYFKDKPSENSYYATPLNMLTQRALDRRTKYAIPLDKKDVPLEATYVSAVANVAGIKVLARSKWLNALHIQGSKTVIENLINLEITSGNKIVDSIEFANRNLTGVSNKKAKTNKISKWNITSKTQTTYNYGQAANQIAMLKGEVLHQNDFTGQGMQIAVMDGGFPGVNSYEAFRRIRENNQILGGYNFVGRNTNFYSGISHGMSVLSTMAGYLEKDVNGSTIDYVGTAPDASYYLFITEDGPNEVKLEESLWVEAAERADSLGVDVLNTSLGYSVFFDNANQNYDYADMDGKTAFITRGAEIASSKGMLLVTSAGNEGNDTIWPYISAPADAVSVLTIGAVNSSRTIASFSSYGPTSDGRTKPDVCAQGQGAYLVNGSTNVVSGNGTSYSSPIMAGLVTCLWQAFPSKSNAEIIKLVKESAHLFSSPNNHEGYGIPNFETILERYDDLDLDGVSNDLDLCDQTPEGADVDTNGCLIVPSNNFKIEVIGETCPDKENGKVIISTETEYGYTATFNGNNYSFSDKVIEINDLTSGKNEVCVYLNNQNYRQCYNFEIEEGTVVSGKSKVSSNKINIELNNGTPPFTIFVNREEKLETSKFNFEVPIKAGDLIEVKSNKDCEGTFSRKIAVDEILHVYPNPVSEILNVEFGTKSEVIDFTIYNSISKPILKRKILKTKPTIDVSFLPTGLYLVKLITESETKTFKIIKN